MRGQKPPYCVHICETCHINICVSQRIAYKSHFAIVERRVIQSRFTFLNIHFAFRWSHTHCVFRPRSLAWDPDSRAQAFGKANSVNEFFLMNIFVCGVFVRIYMLFWWMWSSQCDAMRLTVSVKDYMYRYLKAWGVVPKTRSSISIWELSKWQELD